MADKLADQVSYLIAGAGWRLDAKVKSSAGSSYIPIEQWRVLALLVELNGRTMSVLAQHAFVEPPTLTKMIDRMVADGLVYRVPDAEDRRRILIYMSDAGRARFMSLAPAVAAQERRVRKQLGRGGLAALKRLLDDLSAPDAAESDRMPAKRAEEHRGAAH